MDNKRQQQKEQELEQQLAQEQARLAEVRAEYEAADMARSQLTKKLETSRTLDQLALNLAELAQREPLNEDCPITGAALNDTTQINQHYASMVEQVKTQVDSFKALYKESDQRLTVASEALSDVEAKVRKISAELEASRPLTEARTITRVDKQGISHTFVVFYRRDALMPWAESSQDERRFKRWLVSVTVFMLLLSLILPFVPVPEPKQTEAVEIPDRVAQLIQERKPPPPPPPPPKLAEKKPDEKKDKKKDLKPRKKAPKPKTPEQQIAREKAQRSGLLAFSDDFADLMNNELDEKLGKQARVTSGGEKARRTERSLITTAASKGSGGINTASLSRDVAGSGLSGRGTSRVTGVIGDEFGDAQRPLSDSIKGSRTDEEIQLVFDRNKSALYSIYQRALRKNPTLKGKVVLRITIAPSGKVLKSTIVSSDLGDKVLESKIATRVKLFNFGAKDVGEVTINYPIDFLPA